MELRYGVIFERKKIDGEYILKKKYATIGWVYDDLDGKYNDQVFHACLGEFAGAQMPSVFDTAGLKIDFVQDI